MYQDSSNADGDHELGDGSVPSPESRHRLLLLLLVIDRSRVLILPLATIPTLATVFFSHKLVFLQSSNKSKIINKLNKFCLINRT